MNHNATYSPNRLQKAIGNIAGSHLGFNPSPGGGVKPLPQTAAEIVEIKKIYPQRRYVEFCFPGSDTLQTAHALLDYWHKEGTDKFQPPKNLNIPLNMQKERSWPHTTPETNSPDLLTIVQLILLSGAPTAPAMPPIIQQLNQTLGGQQNTVKLLQTLTGNGSLDIKMLLKMAGMDQTPLKEVVNSAKIATTPSITGVNIPHIPNIPEMEIPTEPLYGAVIPLKGDKTQGYLLLGFIQL